MPVSRKTTRSDCIAGVGLLTVYHVRHITSSSSWRPHTRGLADAMRPLHHLDAQHRADIVHPSLTSGERAMSGGLPFDAKAEAFWQGYLASLPQAQDATHRFYELFQVGKSPEVADEGAALIKHGVKT